MTSTFTGYERRDAIQALLDEATPEQLIDAFLKKTCPDVYDPDDEHFHRTPERFTKMFQELTDGTENFNFTVFKASANEIVIIKNIAFVSMCAHHLAPFVGVAHIGYIPNETMAGISKFARLVKAFAHTLTNQETLTSNIADYIEEVLEPLGVAVVMSASHSCMNIRGALAHNTTTVTSAVRGRFADHNKTAKAEFFQLVTSDV